MTEIQQMIQDALEQFRRIRKKRIVISFFGTLVLVIAVVALIDRTLMFSGWERWLGWIAGISMAVWVARCAAAKACPDEFALAHRLEKEADESAPVVATAIDPSVREIADEEGMSGVMLERLDRRAAEVVKAALPTFPGMMTAPVILALAGILALSTVVGLNGGKGLLRVLLPWTTSAYSSLILEGPEKPVAEGQSFTLTARVSGEPVEEVTIFREGVDTPVANATVDSTGMVRVTMEGIIGPAEFFAIAGDGESEVVRVEPYALPNIAAFEIKITQPAYVANAEVIKNDPSFSVIRGSKMRYSVKLRAPAVSVEIERSAAPRKEEFATAQERGSRRGDAVAPVLLPEEPEIPVFRRDPSDPLVWLVDWNLPEPDDIKYRLVIKGDYGDVVRKEEPWRINVLGDEPPKVSIESHNADDVLRVGNETITFKLKAVDDFGLASACLVFRKPGKAHTRTEIKLPSDTGRTFSGAALLDLAPFNLKPLDLVAVHAEVTDTNTLDGPGIGRSEVIYLEIPLPESDGSDDGGGGGGGGGGMPPINPLEIQMEILRTTVVLPEDANEKERKALAHDQRQNAGYTGQMEAAVMGAGFVELGGVLGKARVSMELATRKIEIESPTKALPEIEAALGFLIEAAQLLQEIGEELPPPPADGPSMQSFTLSPPKPKPSDAKSESEEESEGNESEELRNLMEDVKKQLAEQKALNESASESSDSKSQAESQESLANAALSSAEEARGMSKSDSGDPTAAAEELERAARLQEDTADAMAEGNSAGIAKLGNQSAEALAEALRQLAAQLEPENYNSEPNSPGYERLVSDYLRSISYE